MHAGFGSSLVVRPAADMPKYALDAGAKLILINEGETPFDDLVRLIFFDRISDVVPAVVGKVKEYLTKLKDDDSRTIVRRCGWI